MKVLRLVPFLVLALALSACSGYDPGALAPGYSRIRVHCTGFDLNSYPVSVRDAASNTPIGDTQSLSCIFSGDVHFDVPVPPASYNVYEDNTLIGTANFTASGQNVEVDVSSYMISGGGSF